MPEPAAPRIGCSGLPVGVTHEKYFARFSFLEVDTTFFSLPRPSVLARWRNAAGARGGFALVCWQLVTHPPGKGGYPRLTPAPPAAALPLLGGYRDTESVREALARTFDAARALAAEVVVFRTPPSLSPSRANRDALVHFFQTVALPTRPDGVVLAWEPAGLWEPNSAARLAADAGVVLAVDPLARDPVEPHRPPPLPEDPDSPIYLRIAGVSLHRGRIEPDDMDEIVEIVASRPRAWVALGHAAKARDAMRLIDRVRDAGMLEAAPPDAGDDADDDDDDDDDAADRDDDDDDDAADRDDDPAD